jgi:hypothetical protein
VEFVEVTCPSCFERFEIAAPGPNDLPAVLDYDCEICCHPMEVDVCEEDGVLVGYARGLGD